MPVGSMRTDRRSGHSIRQLWRPTCCFRQSTCLGDFGDLLERRNYPRVHAKYSYMIMLERCLISITPAIGGTARLGSASVDVGRARPDASSHIHTAVCFEIIIISRSSQHRMIRDIPSENSKSRRLDVSIGLLWSKLICSTSV